jgi:hypothetical protein
MQDATDQEPLNVDKVSFSPSAAVELQTAWQGIPRRYASLFSGFEHLQSLVQQVLSFDFRSLHQRQRTSGSTEQAPIYELHLAGLHVKYVISDQCVQVVNVSVATV